MRLLWSDECDGSLGAPPDPNLWGVRETDRWQPPGELQVYTTNRANSHYDGRGHLVLAAIRHAPGVYTSARLSARHTAKPAAFLYGGFEARIKVPTGDGIWPAWWLLGPDHELGWPRCGEIDIMEAPASPSTRNQIHQGVHALHTTDGTDVAVGVEPRHGNWGAGFHTYRVDWTPQRLDFSIDGEHTGTVTSEDMAEKGGQWPFDDQPHSPILNLAIGGWAGTPDPRWTSQIMLVSHVRMFA
jgi:beta-glucanase (GH16 family)